VGQREASFASLARQAEGGARSEYDEPSAVQGQRRGEPREGKERERRRRKKKEKNPLPKSIIDIIHCPSPLSQMSTNRMSKIIILHNVSEGVHPSFQTTVDEWSILGNSVYSITTCLSADLDVDARVGRLTGSILFLAVGSVEDYIQVDEIQLGKSLLGSSLEGSIKIRRHFLRVSPVVEVRREARSKESP
jgi:hypothetical protein